MSATNILRGIRNSGVRLGPLDAAFAGLDYYDGKQQGEDDIRATAGATGSTFGGWGGAMAGAKIGTSLGAFGGPLGMAVGGTAGSIVGGIAGSFAGGYGADRVDETLRGNNKTNKVNNMATINQQTGQVQDDYGNPIYDNYGNPVTANNYQEDTYGWGDLAVTGAGLGLGGYAAKGFPNSLNSVSAVNPNTAYRTARDVGNMSRRQAAAFTARQGADDVFKAARNLPMGAKVAGAAGLAVLGNQVLGNPLGKLADTVTGQRTNFDNDPVNAAKQRQNKQYENQQQAQQKRSTYQEGIENHRYQLGINRAMPQDVEDTQNSLDDFYYNRGKQDYQDQLKNDRNYTEYVNDRKLLESRRNWAMQTRAAAANQMIDNYVNQIPRSVANSLNTTFGQSWV
ncbi:MAG: hypothetical protein WBF90_33765 [Rivularia sp. (in: cyanobacteria)]